MSTLSKQRYLNTVPRLQYLMPISGKATFDAKQLATKGAPDKSPKSSYVQQGRFNEPVGAALS